MCMCYYANEYVFTSADLDEQKNKTLYIYFLLILISLSVIVEQAMIYIHNDTIDIIKMITLYINHNKRQ